MKISDLIKMGLRNLSRRKARTALTIIGMIIGTISIVVMVSIGIGMNNTFQSQVMLLGSLTTITMTKYASIYDEDGNYVDSREQKMDDSLVRLLEGIDHVRAVSPVIYKNMQMYSGKYESWLNVYAMDCSTWEDFDFPDVATGTLPTPENNQIIVFGEYALQNFYRTSGMNYSSVTMDPAVDKITMGFSPWDYQVSERKREFSMRLDQYAIFELTDNYEYDSYAYMDIEYFKDLYLKYCDTLVPEDRKKAVASLNDYEEIRINVDSLDHVSEVQDEIKALGYQTSSLMMYMEPMQETANMLQMVLGAIGGVAMLVSAINIANTMIMAIYERTKEIGIMKVLGCQVRDVKKLFLFEAGMIGLMGGLVGILVSYVASWAINKFGQPLFESLMSGMMGAGTESKFSQIPFWLPFLAAGFSIVVGVISGYFPAKRATKISAIEAMKTEG